MSSFENSFQKYKQNFRNIEKLAKKCVNLKGSIIYIMLLLLFGTSRNDRIHSQAVIYIYIYIYYTYIYIIV